MSGAWDHSVRPLNRGELDDRPCATGKCGGAPMYEMSYRFRIRQSGRVTARRNKVCEGHARRFAELHSLKLPERVTS